MLYFSGFVPGALFFRLTWKPTLLLFCFVLLDFFRGMKLCNFVHKVCSLSLSLSQYEEVGRL